jgi:hypothetical protein
MIAKVIDNKEFRRAIKAGFDGDTAIYKLYAPHINVSTVDDIVEDISARVGAGAQSATLKGVYEKSNLIGYYVYEGKTLISFCLNIQFRNRKYLKEFWSKIRSDLKGNFQTFLWSNNTRGWTWLQKQGMKIAAQDEFITHLTY